jgi:methionyl-tRNA formyltransferase
MLWALTPAPRAIGRKQHITPNPIDTWSQEENIPRILVETKIDDTIKKQILKQTKPDILVVVDFGYLIPQWLLDVPVVAPINIHPSLLPRWRGSSPGQFVLLSGETESAVTVIVMNDSLDEGNIIHQEPLIVEKNWTQTEYYDSSFRLISHVISSILNTFLTTTTSTPQPLESPTVVARRLTKDDSFVPWEKLSKIVGKSIPQHTTISLPKEVEDRPIVQALLDSHPQFMHPLIIEHACRAFSPWPRLWTIVPTNQGEKRMQILECEITAQNILDLKMVTIEGMPAKSWQEVKSLLLL